MHKPVVLRGPAGLETTPRVSICCWALGVISPNLREWFIIFNVYFFLVRTTLKSFRGPCMCYHLNHSPTSQKYFQSYVISSKCSSVWHLRISSINPSLIIPQTHTLKEEPSDTWCWFVYKRIIAPLALLEEILVSPERKPFLSWQFEFPYILLIN